MDVVDSVSSFISDQYIWMITSLFSFYFILELIHFLYIFIFCFRSINNMAASSTTYNRERERRSTAGINKRYDENEYVLVSFPHANKHSIVPSASIDIDPLDKQNGSIKTFGTRKNLRIVANGIFDQYFHSLNSLFIFRFQTSNARTSITICC